MSDIPAVRRQLKIKSGAVQRLFKETSLYRKEVEQLEVRKSELIQQGKEEEWDVRNISKMIEESKKLVGDTRTRLDKALTEFEALITSAKENSALEKDEELSKAEKILKEATA